MASRILVFIHAVTDWMVAPLGPSRSKCIVEPWHLKLLSCSTAEGNVLPNNSVCCTGLLGGVGVNVLGSTRGALCVKGECKGGGMSRSFRRTGVVMPHPRVVQQVENLHDVLEDACLDQLGLLEDPHFLVPGA